MFAWFKSRPKVVSVAFRDLASPAPDGLGGAYAYAWSLSTAPEVGMRVFVPGGDGRSASAVIVDVGAAPPRGMTLKSVARLASAAEVQAAHDAVLASKTTWLDMARKAAGLPIATRKRKPPEGFDVLPPADGKASASEAGQYGRVWWRAFKLAQELGRPVEEVSRFESIARRWYAVRDKGGNRQR